MDKEVVYIYIDNGILFSHKKIEILPFARTWMQLESIMLSKRTLSEKDKCHLILLMCRIYETKQMSMRKKKRNRQTKK